jgi:hypothetical protein
LKNHRNYNFIPPLPLRKGEGAAAAAGEVGIILITTIFNDYFHTSPTTEVVPSPISGEGKMLLVALIYNKNFIIFFNSTMG